MRRKIIADFDGVEGTTRDVPGGPHFVPMLQVDFPNSRFTEAVSWMMLNRGALNILVHPITGDEVADHGDHAAWLGDAQAINFDALR